MKYGVFFVEDEVGIRDRIKGGVDWDSTDFVYLQGAPDGEVALPDIIKHRPDILVTDIKMPFMDGLELSRIVREKLPETQIILLSGYDDFEYAKKAISIGVSEYLLKPVTPPKLLDALRRVSTKIEEKHRLSEYLEHLEEEVRDSRAVLAEKYLKAVVSGGTDVEEAFAHLGELGVPIFAARYRVFIIFSQMSGDKAELSARLSTYSELIFEVSYHETCVILTGDEPGLAESVRKLRSDFAGFAEQSTGENFLGCGRAVQRLTAVPESYSEAQSCIEMRLLYSSGSIIEYHDENAGTPGTPSFIPLDRGPLLDFLRTGLAADLERVSADLVERHGASRGNPDFSVYATMAVSETVRQFLEQLEYDPDDYPEIVPDLEAVKTPGGDARFIRRALAVGIQLRIMNRDDRTRRTVAFAKDFIRSHHRRNISFLQEIADQLGLSTGHLNMVFKSRAGMTINRFVRRTRIDKAKELLRSTDWSIARIGEAVGYEDANYFSTVFGKLEGVPPLEYRKQES